ncbi:MAG: glycerate kinase [Deferrisomatales bacterium]|nr:glycerate kinase [Deferrisomatales bacterium]
MFHAAVDAADPRRAVHAHLRRDGDRLAVRAGAGEVFVPLPRPGRGRVIVVGAGKGAAPMARAVEEILEGQVWGGVVCVKDGHGSPLERVRVLEAAHPMPDERGVRAAEQILDLVRGAGEGDLVLSVLSGGGSALLTLPAPGVSLDDLRALTDLLLASGADIGQINALRKHLSQVKGGRLAAAAQPARVVNLVLSDVVGDRLDVIASGPFTADPSTFSEARGILERYRLTPRVPPAVLRALEAGERGELAETPKPGDPALGAVVHAVVGSNRLSLEAAAVKARELGYRPLILSSRLQGEAREAARFLAAIAVESRASGEPVSPPACLLAGGETTVTLRGKGKGGRNQELALALALELAGCPGIVGLSGGTDGTDGPTDAAGAVCDEATAARARALGLEPRRHLEGNDSYPLFAALGDLLLTGPTRTNVMDVQVLLVGAN